MIILIKETKKTKQFPTMSRCLVVLLVLLSGCGHSVECGLHYDRETVDTLCCMAVRDGDMRPYELTTVSSDYHRFPYSVIMAYNYGETKAYVNAYYELMDLVKEQNIPINEGLGKFLIRILEDGMKNGESSCYKRLAYNYETGFLVEQDSLKAINLFLAGDILEKADLIKRIDSFANKGSCVVRHCHKQQSIPGYFINGMLDSDNEKIVHFWTREKHFPNDTMGVKYDKNDYQKCLPLEYFQKYNCTQ